VVESGRLNSLQEGTVTVASSKWKTLYRAEKTVIEGVCLFVAGRNVAETKGISQQKDLHRDDYDRHPWELTDVE
jgi:uncharacterized protein YfiM (DUF2279 family)